MAGKILQFIKMAGEAIRKTFTFLSGVATTGNLDGIFAEPPDRCCYRLEAFASTSDARDLVNDKWRFHKGYDGATASVNMLLTKPFDSGFGSVLLDNDTLGTFFELGYFIDENGLKYISYNLDWRKVLTLYGEDVYQINAVATPAFGPVSDPFEDFPFCLRAYTPDRANKTIKFKTVIRGAITDRRDVNKIDSIYFPKNYEAQIRLKGSIGKNKSSYTQEYAVLNSQLLDQYESKRTPKYSIQLDPIPEFVHEFIEIDVLQSDRFNITGYNSNNPWFHIQTPASNPSAYEPTATMRGRDVGVEFEVEHGYNTGRKRFCLPSRVN